MGRISDWGSTEDERGRSYPCDRHVHAPNLHLYRAIDVDAPPPLVFAWLCQLRVAPYSYDWIDNLGRKSPRRRDPANEALAAGDRMMEIFKLVEFEKDRHLTLVVDQGPFLRGMAVTYQVSPRDGGTRLVVKIAGRSSRWSPMRYLLPTGDLIMMRKQLRTLKALAEAEHSAPARP